MGLIKVESHAASSLLDTLTENSLVSDFTEVVFSDNCAAHSVQENPISCHFQNLGNFSHILIDLEPPFVYPLFELKLANINNLIYPCITRLG